MFSAEESTQSSYAMRSRASSVCITAIAASKYLMYSAWLGQSSGATMESPLLPASSSAVEGRTAPSRCECSSAFFQPRYGEAMSANKRSEEHTSELQSQSNLGC